MVTTLSSESPLDNEVEMVHVESRDRLGTASVIGDVIGEKGEVSEYEVGDHVGEKGENPLYMGGGLSE